jgi:hypothetical protein
MKNTRWLAAASKGTDIHWSKSQREMSTKLTELGLSEIRFTRQRERLVLEFCVTLPARETPRAVRMIVPLRAPSADETKRERDISRLHRVLYHHLQSKFVAIAAGLSDFDEEFMPHLVLTDQHGHARTLGEALLPAYRQAIDSGDKADFPLWGEGSRQRAQ